MAYVNESTLILIQFKLIFLHGCQDDGNMFIKLYTYKSVADLVFGALGVQRPGSLINYDATSHILLHVRR